MILGDGSVRAKKPLSSLLLFVIEKTMKGIWPVADMKSCAVAHSSLRCRALRKLPIEYA